MITRGRLVQEFEEEMSSGTKRELCEQYNFIGLVTVCYLIINW